MNMTNNSGKYEVLIKQYLPAFLDIQVNVKGTFHWGKGVLP